MLLGRADGMHEAVLLIGTAVNSVDWLAGEACKHITCGQRAREA